MPRFFDDYSNTYLTHDSAAGRKQQRRGWKFRENFKLHYQKHVVDWQKGEMGLASAQQAFIRARGKEDPIIPPLPDGWTEDTDECTGITFYFNDQTGERTWARPGFIPPPPGGGGMNRGPPPHHRGGMNSYNNRPNNYQNNNRGNFHRGGPPPFHSQQQPPRGGPPPPPNMGNRPPPQFFQAPPSGQRPPPPFGQPPQQPSFLQPGALPPPRGGPPFPPQNNNLPRPPPPQGFQRPQGY